ncbi:MAG: pentapeptide repeat-containing protein [Deltaproteobacteria bacterium]|nr:pentapeptide repeat-containing protein [Deltaproteobacteria bacterium]
MSELDGWIWKGACAFAALRRALHMDDAQAVATSARRLRNLLEVIEQRMGTRAAAEAQQLFAAADARAPMRVSLERYRTPGGIIDACGAFLEHAILDDLELARSLLAGIYLREIAAPDARFDDSDVTLAVLVRVRAPGSSWRRARLDGCLLEECDLGRANLEHTTWTMATVVGCMLAGAVLTDARLDDALFVECDLRGADLRAIDLAGRTIATAARFVRCDLRGADLDRRDLTGVTFADCRTGD